MSGSFDSTEDSVMIPSSKRKLALLFLGALVFVAMGFWFVAAPPTLDNHFIFKYPVVIIAVGLVSIVFFGLCACYIFFRLFDTSPGLVINKSGIIDNSSGVAAKDVSWSDVERIDVMEIFGQKFVLLFVQNPELYITRQKSRIKRFMMRRNFNMCGTPITIAPNGLKISFDELLKNLNFYYAMS